MKTLMVLEAAQADAVEVSGLVAVDPPLRNALRVVEQMAKRSSGVLITGPTGVGKELLAAQVHARSGRRGAFVAINCAAFSEGLAESALFGHVRGAFTGAVSNAQGAFVEAHRGTLFLDEMGELDPSVQAKLLRVLEEGSVRPVGASKSTPVDVRIVAATNRDLRQEISASRFRADLFFRIATFIIEVPALRERPGDLDALIQRFLAQHDRAPRVLLSTAARRALLNYAWPGNVRELRNVMERILALAPPGEISEATLLTLAPELSQVPVDAPPAEGASLRQALARTERRLIRARLASGDGHRQRLADDLGVHRTTLWRKMKRLSASDDPPPSRV
ncbi:sigma-54 interaction domain-containing protein [Pendulispora albinea]|uniref:Sigma 54-interacting transcriptional regulator n=1 Tax=Pendulispora albinea TaxID=2741071 RepID=A0ABZ2LW89_9BACT